MGHPLLATCPASVQCTCFVLVLEHCQHLISCTPQHISRLVAKNGVHCVHHSLIGGTGLLQIHSTAQHTPLAWVPFDIPFALGMGTIEHTICPDKAAGCVYFGGLCVFESHLPNGWRHHRKVGMANSRPSWCGDTCMRVPTTAVACTAHPRNVASSCYPAYPPFKITRYAACPSTGPPAESLVAPLCVACTLLQRPGPARCPLHRPCALRACHSPRAQP